MRSAALRTLQLSTRGYATAASPSALVFLEHRGGQLNSAVLNAITAASKLGGPVTGVILGAEDEQIDKVVEEAKKCASIIPVWAALILGADFHFPRS
jgi:electron transfer flavoprotein alpha subunit